MPKPLPLLLLFLITATASAEETAVSAIDERIALEWRTRDNPFSIPPHRPTYILPLAYSTSVNKQPYLDSDKDLVPIRGELKFQISFKVPLSRNILGDGSLSFGYTQQSYWQALSQEYSSPFRETNHEPELLLTFPANYRLLGMQGRLITFALNHQSNGRSDPLSRSWNRVMVDFIFERDDWYLSLKPWWRIPEQAEEDDNPDIEHYMGNFELRALRKFGQHSTGFMWRNNLQRDNRNALQLDYTFPINKRLRGYLQIYSGYGESLIDYDHYNNRIGLGVMLVDWL